MISGSFQLLSIVPTSVDNSMGFLRRQETFVASLFYAFTYQYFEIWTRERLELLLLLLHVVYYQCMQSNNGFP